MPTPVDQHPAPVEDRENRMAVSLDQDGDDCPMALSVWAAIGSNGSNSEEKKGGRSAAIISSLTRTKFTFDVNFHCPSHSNSLSFHLITSHVVTWGFLDTFLVSALYVVCVAMNCIELN